MAETPLQRNERRARTEFEAWAKGGSKPYFYPLKQCANGEYVSPYTEFVWKAFFAGWNAKLVEAL